MRDPCALPPQLSRTDFVFYILEKHLHLQGHLLVAVKLKLLSRITPSFTLLMMVLSLWMSFILSPQGTQARKIDILEYIFYVC